MAVKNTLALLAIGIDSFVLGQSATNFTIPNFTGSLAAGSGVLRSLRAPTSNSTFDFSPSDVFDQRDGPGQYHTGDLTFRYRSAGSGNWTEADTAARRLNVSSQPSQDGILVSDLNTALPDVGKGINLARTWASDTPGDLTLSFTIQNNGSSAVDIGSLGMPIEFNNIFTGRTAVETTNKCVLVDPYIGLDAGYLQVTRLTGTGPNLVITPLNDMSKFEAWRFLHEPEDVPLGYQVQTFEGNYAWEIYTQAYAEDEWSSVVPWNAPTYKTLQVGEELTVGLKFSIAEDVQSIEQAVADANVPVAVGIPGYVVPHDLTAKLFVNSDQDILSMEIEPRGALNVSEIGNSNAPWVAYNVMASEDYFGRARLDITYADDRTQAVHYWIANASASAINELGRFLTDEQWFTNTSDPFGRAPSVISYNRDTNNYVLQDSRAWIAGLSDEGGAGSFLAAGMKQAFVSDAEEVSKLEEFVHEVVWGRLQIDTGNETYAVRKSLFFHEPELVPGYQYDPYFNWTTAWDKEAAYLITRAYDYVHVSALYWGLYRAGRTHPDSMLQQQTPEWYLEQAYHTAVFCTSNSSDGTPNTDYSDLGLMGETVWGYILSDLRLENYADEADHLEYLMSVRQDLWATLPDPFGSEMAWDSTGQEGVYYWSDYFNDTATAEKTVASIRGYMPTIAHWGWNGNARRYWDFLYAGDIKLARYERQIHHYGSGLNSLPLLETYRQSAEPQSLEAIYDLRVGYGGNQGPLSNIDAQGFGSMAFHSYPDTLRWDAYSGDYGPNFLGHVLGAATYLVDHPEFGWISFGGNVEQGNNSVTVVPKDMLRKRIFIAPVSLWVTIDAGTISSFTYRLDTQTLQVRIEKDTSKPNFEHGYQYNAYRSQQIRLNWEQTGGQGETNMMLETADKGQKGQKGPSSYNVEVSSEGAEMVFTSSQ